VARFAANLSMLWQELEPYERFDAAASAGFRRVEMLFPHQLEAGRVAESLQRNQLEMVLFDPHPGDWVAGERGLLAIPGRERECLEAIQAAIELAGRLGTPRLNCLAGVQPEDVPVERCLETAAANLYAAAPMIEEAGLLLLVEPVNSLDIPGYVVDTLDKAVTLVRQAQSPAIRLQLDQYHVARAGGDAIAGLRTHFDLIEHVQIADCPGRGQPGTGQQPIGEFLAELDLLDYVGVVGLEYRPQGGTEESLTWLPREERQ
jgi:hydroxypyruvate isomerase